MDGQSNHSDGAWILGLWRIFAASKAALAASLVAGLIAGASSAGLLTYLTRGLETGGAGVESFGAGFFLLCLLSLSSSTVSLNLLSRIGQDNLYYLRLCLTRQILETPYHKVEALGAHRLMAALTEDVENVVAAQETLPSIFIEGSKVFAVFIYLLSLSPLLFLVVIAYVALSVLTMQAPQERARRWLDRARQTENATFNLFRAATEGAKELKMNARRRRAFLDEELREIAGVFRSQRVRALTIFNLLDRWAEALFFSFLGFLLFVIPSFWSIPSETLTGFALSLLFLGGPLSLVGTWLPAISKGVVSIRNLESMGLKLTPKLGTKTVPCEASSCQTVGVIEFRGVTHRRGGLGGGSEYQVGPVDLRIEPGELVFLTGGNGSGKTTLALLIIGLLEPDSGEIRIDGELIGDANRERFRQRFAAVFADAFIFESLVGYVDSYSQAEVDELLKGLGLEGKVEICQGRFSTVNLSRGQRKRLALLSAYVENRPIYFFDEWAAEQDPPFREYFYRHLLPDLKARGKTVIVISHDEAYFDVADRIMRMCSGKIQQIGEAGRQMSCDLQIRPAAVS